MPLSGIRQPGSIRFQSTSSSDAPQGLRMELGGLRIDRLEAVEAAGVPVFWAEANRVKFLRPAIH